MSRSSVGPVPLCPAWRIRTRRREPVRPCGRAHKDTDTIAKVSVLSVPSAPHMKNAEATAGIAFPFPGFPLCLCVSAVNCLHPSRLRGATFIALLLCGYQGQCCQGQCRPGQRSILQAAPKDLVFGVLNVAEIVLLDCENENAHRRHGHQQAGEHGDPVSSISER